ncbi:MAG: hypothetical protein FWE79_01945, partial [Firmicutes bacterium]|nr:hypothetical protein [Bacillota bacterium]
SQVDFSRDAMRLAEKEWNKINDAFMKAISETEGLYEGETLESLETEEIKKIYKEVVEALSDDFNTPIAIAKMIELSKLSNQSISEMKKDETVEEAVNRLIDIVTMAKHFFEPVFGFKFQKEEVKFSDELIKLIDEWTEAKKEENYKLADEIRNKIGEMGFDMQYTKDGKVQLKERKK